LSDEKSQYVRCLFCLALLCLALSVCLPVCLPACLSVCLLACFSAHRPTEKVATLVVRGVYGTQTMSSYFYVVSGTSSLLAGEAKQALP
jgi:hypothetical protein